MPPFVLTPSLLLLHSQSQTHTAVHSLKCLLLAQAYDLPCNCLCGSVVGMRGGLKESGMSAGRDGTINQDCRGIKIGGWGSGRMEESGAHNMYLQILLTKNLSQASLKFFKTLNDLRKCGDEQITLHPAGFKM